MRPTPHGLHSWQCISETLPSFGIVRENCIGWPQLGQLGAIGAGPTSSFFQWNIAWLLGMGF